MYNYLGQHPGINTAHGQGRREVHFFDYEHHYTKGMAWYRDQFPDSGLAVEASPTYLQCRAVPERIAGVYSGNARFIVMLRNPADRAWSDYWLAVRKKWNPVEFEEWIEVEDSIVRQEIEKGVQYYLSCRHLFGYLDRGKYAMHLERWYEHFDRDRFLVLQSERFFYDPQEVMDNVFSWLGVEPFELENTRQWQRASYPPMDECTHCWLTRYFEQFGDYLEYLTVS